MHYIHSFVTVYESIGAWGYWAVFFVALLESLAFVGAFVPGALIVLSVGFACSNGVLDFGDLVWFVATGAIVGDLISYYLGMHGRKLFHSDNKFLKDSYLQKGKDFFKSHGNKSILLGRFIGPLRPVVPFIAGLSHMPKKDFLLWNVVSGFSWAAIFLSLGYFFGSTTKTLEMWITRGGVLFVILCIIFISVGLIIKRSRAIFNFMKAMHLLTKEKITSNTIIKKCMTRHPDLTLFLKRRFQKDKFINLPLTLCILGAFALICMVLIEEYWDSIWIFTRYVDNSILSFIVNNRSSFLTEVFLGFTYLGNFQIVILVSIILIVCFILFRKRMYITTLLLTVLGTEFSVRFLKLAIERPRPGEYFSVYLENGFSFPSGHAAIAVALYGFLTYFLISIAKNREQKILSLSIGSLLIFMIGFSRMYLGVHYLSDVLGGFVLAFVWLLIGIFITELIKIFRKLY